MSDIAKELFKSIVTDTASQEDFGSAIKQKMDQALDVRRAGITADIYNQQVPATATVVEEAYSSDNKHKMDPKSHVELNKETGMYCVYDIKGKKIKEFESKEDAEEYAVKNHDALMKESVELEEASKGDIEKILKFAAKNGGKRKGNVVDFGGSKIEFSLDKGKIKFDGGKNSGVEHFDNLRDAMSALSIGMEV